MRGAVVHRRELALGARQVQAVLLLERRHVHRRVVVHVVHQQRALQCLRCLQCLLCVAAHHDVVVQLHVEARTALQLVAHLDRAFDGAVQHCALRVSRPPRAHGGVHHAVDTLDDVDVQVAVALHHVHHGAQVQVLAHQQVQLALPSAHGDVPTMKCVVLFSDFVLM